MIRPIKLQTLKNKPSSFLENHKNDMVWIRSDNGLWMEGKSGYTERYDYAGIYTLGDAYEATSHCGPEKRVQYEPVGKEYILMQLEHHARMITKMSKILSQIR